MSVLKHPLYFYFLAAFIIFCAFYGFNKAAKAHILFTCVVHTKGSKDHYHTQLSIEQDGTPVTIPANIGITSDQKCMHPVHTHDASGRIHIDYPETVRFRLGDFFDAMGTVFNDNQIGRTRTGDGYKIMVYANDKLIKNDYRSIPLRDKDKIKIILTSPAKKS